MVELLAGRAVGADQPQRPERLAVRSWLDIQKSTHALEQDRPDILKPRRARFYGQPDLDPTRLVFIDVTGLSTKVARLRSHMLRGKRCRAPVRCA